MTRAERRRAEREKNKTATYNLTEEQLEAMVNEKIASELADAEIISRETEASVVTDEDGYQFYNLCCRIRCVENIAQTVPLTVTD